MQCVAHGDVGAAVSFWCSAWAVCRGGCRWMRTHRLLGDAEVNMRYPRYLTSNSTIAFLSQAHASVHVLPPYVVWSHRPTRQPPI